MCFPKMCLNPCVICFCGPCMVVYCLTGNIVSIISSTIRSMCWLCCLDGPQPRPAHDVELGCNGTGMDTRLIDNAANYSI
jgi:hypothetical protein